MIFLSTSQNSILKNLGRGAKPYAHCRNVRQHQGYEKSIVALARKGLIEIVEGEPALTETGRVVAQKLLSWPTDMTQLNVEGLVAANRMMADRA